ncbi:hypothetical protein [Bacillus sp. FJAT-52991]|uniref:Uncharacterized protein n=1 Tax=Bacillus kandeliae TaxID=3129297 RepID=A0ABZ2N2P2_9BACI
MNQKKAKIYMWGFIVLGLVSLCTQGMSIPGVLGSQIGVNPFHALKIIALISVMSALVTYFKFVRIKKGETN